MKTLFAAALLAALHPTVSTAAGADQLHWYYYTLDSSGNSRGYSAARYDKDGDLKVAYRINYDVNLGVFDGEKWTTQKADTGTGSDAKLDMALDGAGNAHIAVHDWRNSEVRYSHLKGSTWTHASLPTNDPSTDFYQISMTSDPNGRIHLSYTSKTKTPSPFSALTYSIVGMDGKLSDPVFACQQGFNGKWNRLTTDKDGNPVAAFFLFEGSNLAIAYTKDGAWTHQVIDSSSDANQKGFHTDIKRDTGGVYTIAYFNRTKMALETATGTPGGSWNLQKVDTMPAYTLFTSANPLSIDDKGNAYIAYTDMRVKEGTTVEKSSLKIAVRSGGTWTTAVVDSSGLAGEYASMDLGKNGLPAITYYERGKGHLRLAVASLTAPPDEDKNGIPDYKEKSIHVSIMALRRAPRIPGAIRGVYDLRGRNVVPHSSGRYFEVSTDKGSVRPVP